MADSLLAYGEHANHLERVAYAPTLSTSEATLFPVTALYDSYPSSPFAFSATSSAQTITCDLSIVTNGKMEACSTANVLTGWTAALGTVAATSAGAYAGSYSMSLIPSTGTTVGAAAYETIEAHSAEKINACLALCSSDGASIVKGFLQNRKTRNWMTSSGAWTASETAFFSHAATSWGYQEVLGVTMETLRDPLCDLRFTISTTSTAATILHADEAHIWPSVNLASIHGHNLDDGMALALLSSTEATFAAPTSEATFTIAQPSMFVALTTMGNHRYWRFAQTGNQDDVVYYGEAVLAQSKTLASKPLAPWTYDYAQDQIRAGQTAQLRADRPVRAMTVTYTVDSTTQADEHYGIYRTGSAYPVIYVPLSTEATVIYGRIKPEYQQKRDTAVSFAADISIDEMAFFTLVP